MNEDMVLFIGRRSLEVCLLLMAPTLIVTLVVGFAAALLQAVTSIRDMSMGMVLKMAFIAVTLVVSGNWMMQTAVSFTRDMFNMMQTLVK